jgi:Domain of Unknown Function (DUF1080)
MRYTGFLLAAIGFITGDMETKARADGKSAPPSAVILIAAHDPSLSGWVRRNDTPAAWNVHDDYIEIAPGKGDIVTKDRFGDFQLHVEFWIPLMANKKGQARGNSGVYLQGRYEIQVLDSFHNDTYVDGSCGALYKIIAPSRNASKPPEEWQTYDITFRAPRVDREGHVTEKGEVTVVHNGVTIIDRGRFDHSTPGALDTTQGTPGPIMLQDHGARVRYRNVWLKPM